MLLLLVVVVVLMLIMMIDDDINNKDNITTTTIIIIYIIIAIISSSSSSSSSHHLEELINRDIHAFRQLKSPVGIEIPEANTKHLLLQCELHLEGREQHSRMVLSEHSELFKS